MDPKTKPLGIKAYHSIPHLYGSTTGPRDNTVSIGQHKLATEPMMNDPKLLVHIAEKMDGSCTAVALHNGQILALGRAGYLASHSEHEHLRMFDKWVKLNEDRFRELLEEGERIVGEWMGLATGTLYHLKGEPWYPFDILRGFAPRATNLEMSQRVYSKGWQMPPVIWCGQGLSPAFCMEKLDTFGFAGAQTPCEGLVYRVERGPDTLFLAKYIRQGYEAGRYLSSMTGEDPIWNWRF